MPFKKVGPDDYVSPSGRHFNKAQVQLYYARGGTFKKPPHGRRKLAPGLKRKK
jgi:hypothetical protein